jgi:hypothetical protein
VTVIEVTDLDSACGFRGANLIEKRTVLLNKPEIWPSAINAIGSKLLPNGDIDCDGAILERGSKAYKLCLAYSILTYRGCDTERSEVIQIDPDETLNYDGWQAKRLEDDSLEAYVAREWLK